MVDNDAFLQMQTNLHTIVELISQFIVSNMLDNSQLI